MEQKHTSVCFFFCVHWGVAKIQNYEKIKKYFRNDDYYIYCDAGLKHQARLGVWPDLIIGDFDSYAKDEMEQKYQRAGAAAIPADANTAARDSIPELIVLPCEKDDTDTVFAVKEGMRRGFSEFLLLGAIGQRLDHTLGNVSILLMLDKAGRRGMIVDDYSEMSLVGQTPAYIDESFSYFSVLNISGKAEGVTIEGAKYPLKDAVISCDYQYGVSNEVLAGERAVVSVADGRLLLIKVF